MIGEQDRVTQAVTRSPWARVGAGERPGRVRVGATARSEIGVEGAHLAKGDCPLAIARGTFPKGACWQFWQHVADQRGG